MSRARHTQCVAMTEDQIDRMIWTYDAVGDDMVANMARLLMIYHVALSDIADPNRLASAGDPGVLRERAATGLTGVFTI